LKTDIISIRKCHAELDSASHSARDETLNQAQGDVNFTIET